MSNSRVPFPFAVDPAKVTIQPGMSYTQSAMMGVFGSVVEHNPVEPPDA